MVFVNWCILQGVQVNTGRSVTNGANPSSYRIFRHLDIFIGGIVDTCSLVNKVTFHLQFSQCSLSTLCPKAEAKLEACPCSNCVVC